MARSQAFSRQAANGSQYEDGYYGTNGDHESRSSQEDEAQAQSTRRLEVFFANQNSSSGSPFSWRRTSTSSATKNIQTHLQAFDVAFYGNDTKRALHK
ncbi:hypothetical protein OIDMADRAFT_58458 [Oidiodendron maius Zn]|uniref:Uncharacterized protein n=1 Tax=Oidiodendron maius (strain Zn) TaxID=913774 RepID=A0A0C3H2Z2_OIDMZ|nr:hypothetical protein OIDMADRAFT_58458 [Oidiodendron maius Zn]